VRRRRFGGFRGRKKAPLNLSWVNGVFNTSLDTTGATFGTPQVLVDGPDWQANLGGLSKPGFVRRVIVNFTIVVNFRFEGALERRTGFFWAVYVEDDDEQDSTLLSTAPGTIIQENRLLATGVRGWHGTSLDTNSPFETFSPMEKVDWKGRLRLQSNERVVLAIQSVNDIDAAATAVEAITFSRVLIESP